ncbi:protein BatD [Dyella terrae]|uniref:Protein BatD n=3 Tax=Rhodanobacteraceae TaxID=1775411 RepID=A0A4R0YQK2_9GAMM|nr:protein BatD [Dyella terrae]TCI08706.1 protein BatD [Dyella soli]
MLSLLPVWVAATEVRASLDRDKVALGETVTLNLRVEGGGMFDAPDLSALNKDFTVLGTSNNTSISIINGKRSAQLVYGVALRPNRVGTLTIPSLTFANGSTQALTLEVTPADDRAVANGRKDVYLEASLDPREAWVGEQVVYTVRLYLASPLANGSLDEPRVQGVELSKISDDLNYQQEKGGRRYNVIERRYALIPQKAGKLEIPPIAFSGELVEMADPDSFFGSTRAASAISQPVTLDVKAVPAEAGKTAWLPARELTLSLDGADARGALHVGQTLNLTMTVQATGLPYEALPSLSLPSIDGATVYPDKPVNGTRVIDSWLQGRRQQGFAVVPSRAGKLDIPATTLTWFNVRTGQSEVARIAPVTLDVLPATGTPAPAAPQDLPAPNVTAPAATTSSPSRQALVAGGIVLLLVGGAVGFALSRRRSQVVAAPAPTPRAPSIPSGSRGLRASFIAAARGSDPKAQYESLLAWARHERPGIQTLGDVEAQLASAEQGACIGLLQRSRYAPMAERIAGDRLAAAFRDGFQWKDSGPRETGGALAPLYPFKTD